jgi:ABC-type nitrate/sulfonate/bicarbonate transport system ATPase subunit
MQHTVFMVTHDVDEALLLSDRIALMANGPEARLAETVPKGDRVVVAYSGEFSPYKKW